MARTIRAIRYPRPISSYAPSASATARWNTSAFPTRVTASASCPTASSCTAASQDFWNGLSVRALRAVRSDQHLQRPGPLRMLEGGERVVERIGGVDHRADVDFPLREQPQRLVHRSAARADQRDLVDHQR